VVILVSTLTAYFPAWHGGPLWDDDNHLTRPELQSLHGLWRIWFDMGATKQYYPVAHSAFWAMQRLWGADPLGYHLVNIVLHASSAFLLLLILRRLAVPGAALASLVFALHPVQVESVAWMTELKNTLSGVFYFSAALAYLEFDVSRRRWRYGLALGLFVLAILTKTVTATLPAALLVVFWWRRGTLRVREDVVPLVPFFVLGLGSGLMTAWLERSQIGAEGAAFQFTMVERVLIAGRAVWFYLGTLVWPAHLTFIYPRWQVSQAVWWQYLFPAALAALIAGLLAWSRRSRAPLAALLIFVGTLFPALGFVNVYPFLFSFVADHFQYLACGAVIAIGSAAITTLARRWRPNLDLNLTGRLPAAGTAVLVLVGVPLAAMTWDQSRQYADAETLYRATIARNPACWLAYNNLGLLVEASAGPTLERSGDPSSSRLTPEATRAFEEAVGDFTEAIRLKPDLWLAENNLARALLALGRIDEATVAVTEALHLKPDDADAHYDRGLLLAKTGRRVEAISEMRESIRLSPDRATLHAGLADDLFAGGDLEGAIAEYREAARLDPTDAETHNNLGAALGRAGRVDAAMAEYEEALRLDPRHARSANNLGVALLSTGRSKDAIEEFQVALRIDPTFARAHYGLATALDDLGRPGDAVAEFRQALVYQPGFAEAHNQLGVSLAELGRTQEAVAEFKEAIRLKPDFADARANLAKALGGGEAR
jgi:Flp pilus assembly protein TadD